MTAPLARLPSRGDWQFPIGARGMGHQRRKADIVGTASYARVSQGPVSPRSGWLSPDPDPGGRGRGPKRRVATVEHVGRVNPGSAAAIAKANSLTARWHPALSLRLEAEPCLRRER